MKKLPILSLAFVLIAVFVDQSVGQVKGSEGTKTERRARLCSNCYVCSCSTGSAGCLCPGAQVLQVDDRIKTTFRIKRTDGSITMLDASKLTPLPKVGQIVRHRCALGQDLCPEMSTLCPLHVGGGPTR